MTLRFASCSLDPRRHLFERDGEALRLEPQVFDLIRVLAEAGGRMLSREELIAQVWAGLNVSDATIAARISAARRAVGDDGKAQGIIETVPRRGFRLAVPVETEAPAEAAPAAIRRDLPTLAVLPFRYPAQDPQDMLADGLVDEINGALGRVHQFHVIARQSAYALKESPTDIPTAARRLGADYLVDGSVRRAGDRLRVTVELADADGVSIWSARFDERLDDLFDLQDRIAMQVAGQLPVPLRSAEIQRARSRGTSGAAGAQALILQAMPQFWAHQAQANAQAVRLFRQASALEPGNAQALAYAAWAQAQAVSYLWSEHPEADRAEALATAQQAAEIAGDDDPAALTAISGAYALTHPDRGAAASFARRALAIDPSNAWARLRLGWALIYDRQIEAALSEFENARRLSPLDPFYFNMEIGTASALGIIGRLDEAITIMERTLTDHPGIRWAYRILAMLHGRAGHLDKAAEAGRRLLQAYPGLTLERLQAYMPLSLFAVDDAYLEGLRRAGIPER